MDFLERCHVRGRGGVLYMVVGRRRCGRETGGYGGTVTGTAHDQCKQ